MLTDNSILINSALKNYDLFKVPTSFVEAKKTKRHYTALDKCDLDIKTGTNKIGDIVNLSQLLQSIMWNRIYDETKNNRDIPNKQIIENNLDLYKDVCILAVMSGIEIDKAKREFDVNTTRELRRLKDKYVMRESDTAPFVDKNGEQKEKEVTKMVKPMFFKMITLNNGYTLNPLHIYRYFHTPMDYLQKEINKFNFRKNRIKDEIVPFSDIIKPINVGNIAQSYYQGKDRIIELIKGLNDEIRTQYRDYDTKPKAEKDEIRQYVSELKQECVEYINDISIPNNTMYLILKELDNENNQGYARLILNILFGTPNEKFFKLILDTSSGIGRIAENEYGSIKLFDVNFIKIPA